MCMRSRGYQKHSRILRDRGGLGYRLQVVEHDPPVILGVFPDASPTSETRTREKEG